MPKVSRWVGGFTCMAVGTWSGTWLLTTLPHDSSFHLHRDAPSFQALLFTSGSKPSQLERRRTALELFSGGEDLLKHRICIASYESVTDISSESKDKVKTKFKQDMLKLLRGAPSLIIADEAHR